MSREEKLSREKKLSCGKKLSSEKKLSRDKDYASDGLNTLGPFNGLRCASGNVFALMSHCRMLTFRGMLFHITHME